MDDTTRRKLLNRLSRAQGQLTGVQRMVEDDTYCVDTLLQIAAVRGALEKAGHVLLRYHIENCVAEACNSGDSRDRQRKIDELMEVFSRHGGIT